MVLIPRQSNNGVIVSKHWNCSDNDNECIWYQAMAVVINMTFELFHNDSDNKLYGGQICP